MVSSEIPRLLLESSLRELCLSQNNPRELEKFYREKFQQLDPQDFPPSLRSKFKSLRKQFSLSFDPSTGTSDRTGSKQSLNIETIVDDLFVLYSRLQSLKAPYVDKKTFLKRSGCSIED